MIQINVKKGDVGTTINFSKFNGILEYVKRASFTDSSVHLWFTDSDRIHIYDTHIDLFDMLLKYDEVQFTLWKSDVMMWTEICITTEDISVVVTKSYVME